MNILVNFPDEQVNGLKSICEAEGISRSEAIRQAVAAKLKSSLPICDTFALWRSSEIKDGLEYQQKIRKEW